MREIEIREKEKPIYEVEILIQNKIKYFAKQNHKEKEAECFTKPQTKQKQSALGSTMASNLKRMMLPMNS